MVVGEAPVVGRVLELLRASEGLAVGGLGLDHCQGLGCSSVIPKGNCSVGCGGGPVFQVLVKESGKDGDGKVGGVLDAAVGCQAIEQAGVNEAVEIHPVSPSCDGYGKGFRRDGVILFLPSDPAATRSALDRSCLAAGKG